MARWRCVSFAALVAAIGSGGAHAEIISVASGNSGGTTPQLSLVSYINPNDGVNYTADFTSVAPIDIGLKVGPTASLATYFVGLPFGDTVVNDTGSPLRGFEVSVQSLNPGIVIEAVGHDTGAFPNLIVSNPYEVEFAGPPGLQAGANTAISLTLVVPAFSSDFQDLAIRFTPIAAPEAPTWAMMLAGFAGLGLAARRALMRRERRAA